MTVLDVPEPLLLELIETADLVTATGQRMRSDPGTHELSLAALCNVLGRIVERNPALVGQ